MTTIERHPQYVGAHSLLAYINIMELINGWGDRSPDDLATGAAQAARTALDEVKRLQPDFSIAKLTQRAKQTFKYEEDFERYAEGLRLAGAPEE